MGETYIAFSVILACKARHEESVGVEVKMKSLM